MQQKSVEQNLKEFENLLEKCTQCAMIQTRTTRRLSASSTR